MFRKKYKVLVFFLFLFISCKDKKNPIADVAGIQIYLNDIDKSIEARLYQHLMEIYYDRLISLEKLIEWNILHAEAGKRGMKYVEFLDSLYKVNIYDRKSDTQNVQDTLDFNVNFEQTRHAMNKISERNLRKHWVDSLKEEYRVKIYLTKPDKIIRIDMGDVQCHYRYGSDAPLTLWVISDFDCTVCKELQPVFETVAETYMGKINYSFVFFSDRVTQAAIASVCAERQGKFVEMKKMLYDSYENHKPELYVKLAYKAGLDTVRFKRDFNDPVIFNTINSHIETLYNKGIFGTPTIVVGNRMYLNVNSEAELSRIIDSALKKKR